MNACQDELKEEKSIMKEWDTNIDSCIQREEECSDKRRRFSTKLNKCRSDKRKLKINCKDNLKLNETMHEIYGIENIGIKDEYVPLKLSYTPKMETIRKLIGLPCSYSKVQVDQEIELVVLIDLCKKYPCLFGEDTFTPSTPSKRVHHNGDEEEEKDYENDEDYEIEKEYYEEEENCIKLKKKKIIMNK
ncbi:hypothetical protein HHI36_001485 [Cryptolaemus montrouzieri]|uniref:Uncharacterized protein n=1 Tax=Cryptolaemus montrouzieri TaxID=559131 RepID=A0ABD2P7K1_9CUCU